MPIVPFVIVQPTADRGTSNNVDFRADVDLPDTVMTPADLGLSLSVSWDLYIAGVRTTYVPQPAPSGVSLLLGDSVSTFAGPSTIINLAEAAEAGDILWAFIQRGGAAVTGLTQQGGSNLWAGVAAGGETSLEVTAAGAANLRAIVGHAKGASSSLVLSATGQNTGNRPIDLRTVSGLTAGAASLALAYSSGSQAGLTWTPNDPDRNQSNLLWAFAYEGESGDSTQVTNTGSGFGGFADQLTVGFQPA